MNLFTNLVLLCKISTRQMAMHVCYAPLSNRNLALQTHALLPCYHCMSSHATSPVTLLQTTSPYRPCLLLPLAHIPALFTTLPPSIYPTPYLFFPPLPSSPLLHTYTNPLHLTLHTSTHPPPSSRTNNHPPYQTLHRVFLRSSPPSSPLSSSPTVYEVLGPYPIPSYPLYPVFSPDRQSLRGGREGHHSSYSPAGNENEKYLLLAPFSLL